MTAEEVIPESGSVIYDVVGASNIHLFCDLRNNGSAVLVNWFKLSAEDREEGRSPDAIVNDGKFTLSGDIVEGFSLNTNLTISSLTEDLDDVIIFCGLDEFAANFTLRIYCKACSVYSGCCMCMCTVVWAHSAVYMYMCTCTVM